jgi:outer membrane protein OmpA-like peptidoglycan-associated protein
MYPEGERYTVDMTGTSIAPNTRGSAQIKFENGRSHLKLTMRGLAHPQSIGAAYTTYLLWAVTPDGRVGSIGELPVRDSFTFTGTTPLQSFGLMITAEPYSAVTVPGAAVVAENVVADPNRAGSNPLTSEPVAGQSTIDRSAEGEADYQTPLSLLGARRAVQAAGEARAEAYAPGAWRDVHNRLAALEQSWTTLKPDQARFVRQFNTAAHEAMRSAESSRQLSIAAAREAQRRAEESTARALDTARRVALEAAVTARDELVRARQQADAARARAEQAQTDAEREKARAELARTEAVVSHAEAEKIRLDAEAARSDLMNALSGVLETRHQDRGLVCNFSDVWFDFDTATLTPGGSEKLQKVASVLLRHQGGSHVEIEGHADAFGSDEYNLKLSQQRAEAVRRGLEQAGVDPSRIVSARGVGSACPVASNDTREGRQLNRRVEIIITAGPPIDADSSCQSQR